MIPLFIEKLVVMDTRKNGSYISFIDCSNSIRILCPIQTISSSDRGLFAIQRKTEIRGTAARRLQGHFHLDVANYCQELWPLNHSKIVSSNFLKMMQAELKKTPEKLYTHPPPVPPKPKNYHEYKEIQGAQKLPRGTKTLQDYKDSFKSMFSLPNVAIEELSRVESQEIKRKYRRDPPPVPPKPNCSLRVSSSNSEHQTQPSLSLTSSSSSSDTTAKSNLRVKNSQNGDELDKRRGILIKHPLPPQTLFLSFASSTIDAFTTEDKDLFANPRSLSVECKATNSSFDPSDVSECQSFRDPLEVVVFREEVLTGIAEEYSDEESDSLNSSYTELPADQPHKRLARHCPGLLADGSEGSCHGPEPLRRVKLSGSVSFTSFDSVRNSSAKEVNLKKQIFKQLFERSERNIHKQDNFDLCLGEGNFSDEEGNFEHENSITNLCSSQQNISSCRSDEADKLHRVAQELLGTEESYVKRLHLIDQVFHFEILMKNRELNMFPKEQLVQMFSNIKSIYEFHNDFLLMQLRKRLKEWDETPRIGDIMKRFAPFLKLYTGYVQNFVNAISVIKFWTEKSTEFSNLLEKLQKRPECGQMSLQHHMLEPIQRVPRYLVLLKQYIKYLPEDSSDRSDSMAALDLVQKAASHSNENLRAYDQFQKMIAINERLGNLFNIIDPGRKFIKEGMLKRISPKDGSQTDRYLFLFHDILLICQGVLKLSGKHQYKVKMKLDTSDLELVEDSHSLQTPESFHLICKEKCLELLAQNQKSRAEWITAFNSCINSSKFRRSSAASQLSNEDLGKRAPLWTKNQETSMCMNCASDFSFFLKKRHCHACGIVVCTKCSPNKIQLEFTANKSKRVCLKCFLTLQGPSCLCPKMSGMPKCHPNLKMKAFDSHVLCGYLKISQDRKSWQDLYVTINENFVLYTFKAHKDVKAHSSLPLPGYSVDIYPTAPKIFVISHKGWIPRNYFLSDNEEVTQQWIKVLKTIAEAELPPDFRGCLSQKCPHHSV